MSEEPIPPEHELRLGPLLLELPGDETEPIPYNPSNQTKWGDIDLTIPEGRLRVHDTNNLHHVIDATLDIKPKSKKAVDLQELRQFIYRDLIDHYDLEELKAGIEAKYPKLYLKVMALLADRWSRLDIVGLAAEEHGLSTVEYETAKDEVRLTPREDVEQRYYLSKFFDAMAEVAAEQGRATGLAELAP